MEPTARIEELLTPTLEAMGFNVVRVRFFGGEKPTLQVMAEPLDGAEMTVEHCADISRAASAILDVEDPIPGAYDLEVSSPGMDRPLVKLRDFEAYAGHVAKIELKKLRDGRKRHRGRLLGVEDGMVRLDRENGELATLPFDEIADAKLVVTDELIAEALRKQADSDGNQEKELSENA